MSINFEEIKDIKARRRAFIEDEAAFYNSKNRAVTLDAYNNEICVYTPTKNSPGCAIGRHLDRDCFVIHGSVHGGIKILLYSYDKEIANSFPLWMQEMGADFLKECQGLHDLKNYWNENGLSEDGKIHLNLILGKYC